MNPATADTTEPRAPKLRINSVRSKEARGNNDYFTPLEAVIPLLHVEDLPHYIWEPACGDGAIVLPLRAAGHDVIASDIVDYGLPGTILQDYLKAEPDWFVEGVVTNPPYDKLALEFAKKALTEVKYVALLLRLNWLETPKRKKFFGESGLSRVWVMSRRLPMMHKLGYEGKKSTSNCCYAWYVWDHRKVSAQGADPLVKFIDWQDWFPKPEKRARKARAVL